MLHGIAKINKRSAGRFTPLHLLISGFSCRTTFNKEGLLLVSREHQFKKILTLHRLAQQIELFPRNRGVIGSIPPRDASSAMCPHLLIGFFPNSDKLTGVLTQELGLVINSWSMSALPPKADIDWRFVHVPFVP